MRSSCRFPTRLTSGTGDASAGVDLCIAADANLPSCIAEAGGDCIQDPLGDCCEATGEGDTFRDGDAVALAETPVKVGTGRSNGADAAVCGGISFLRLEAA